MLLILILNSTLNKLHVKDELIVLLPMAAKEEYLCMEYKNNQILEFDKLALVSDHFRLAQCSWRRGRVNYHKKQTASVSKMERS